MGQAFVGRLGRRGTALPGEGEVATVGQVSGACFVMRRDTWEHVGGFDEGFFLWYDDVDLARRLIDLGYRNLVVGAAVVTHTGAASFAQLDQRRAQAIRLDSLERYLLKHHPRSGRATRPALAAARRLRAR
jgi:N-acetylglucosaminyl-diphospho-decaprenol L-rhamnosyltransferase